MKSFSLKKWIVLLSLGPCLTAGAQSVIVHESNPMHKVSRGFVRNAFLGNSVDWPNQAKIQIADYTSGFPLRAKFSEEWLGLSPNKVYMLWIKVSLSGRAAPPRVFKNEDEVKRFVLDNPDAIAYISNTAGLPKGLRAIEVEP